MHDNLLGFVVWRNSLSWRQSPDQSFDVFRCDASVLRELDLELNVKLALHERILMHGHAFIFNSLNIARTDQLALFRLHNKLSLVKMLNDEMAATESFNKFDSLLHQQVIALPNELWMLFLLYNEDDVAGQHSRLLIRLTRKRDLLVVLHTLVDLDLKHFLLLGCLLSATFCALVLGFDAGAGTFAIRAASLHLLDHTRSNLSHNELHTMSIT
mmetsp:Transcript_14643/g.49991  ORF Transcript_14643/g.49991 Transcript_14643/m.49991 type:complete len:213 (-) Transcript_14643:665-1303(-)